MRKRRKLDDETAGLPTASELIEDLIARLLAGTMPRGHARLTIEIQRLSLRMMALQIREKVIQGRENGLSIRAARALVRKEAGALRALRLRFRDAREIFHPRIRERREVREHARLSRPQETN